jgi:hypothetical protein
VYSTRSEATDGWEELTGSIDEQPEGGIEMNSSATARNLLSYNAAKELATGKILCRVVLGITPFALLAGAALAICFVATPKAVVPEAGSQRWGALSETYAPIDAEIAGIGTGCCSHVAGYGFEAAGDSADSARCVAQGASYVPDYGHIAGVASARWTALGLYYMDHVAHGQ